MLLLTCKKVCQNVADFSPRSVAEPSATPSSPHWQHALLAQLRLIRVGGVDRSAFLQGQLTQDLRTITATRSALCGWANAQGRLLLVGQVFSWNEACWLTAGADTAAALARRLQQFVLRARVTVELTDLALLGLNADRTAGWPWAGAPAAAPLAGFDGGDWYAMRVAGDPARILVAAAPTATGALEAVLAAAGMDQQAWQLADIRAGIPLLGAALEAAFVPQMVNLELLGGVHFAKGCYSGQEIVNRTHHLGRIKRRMLRFGCAGATPPACGDAVHGTGGEAGRVVAAAPTPQGCELLAVVHLDALAGGLWADAARRLPLVALSLPYEIPASG